MTRLSRRKFLYLGVGVAAAAGLGYLTEDYWYSRMHEAYKELCTRMFPERSSTTTTTASTSTETHTPTTDQTQSPTSIAKITPTPTTSEGMSEDEVMIRELLDEWMKIFNGHNVPRIVSLYTENAVYFSHAGGTRIVVMKGQQEISGCFAWHAEHNSVINNYKIQGITVSDNKAEVQASYYYSTDVGGTQSFAKYTLVKISEIDRGQAKFKLARPIWRISYFESFM